MAKHDLLTPELREIFAKYPLYSQDGKGKRAKVIARFFLPHTAWSWYVLEASTEEVRPLLPDGSAGAPTFELYGYTVNGSTAEAGYFFLSELESLEISAPVINQDGRKLGRIPLWVEWDKEYSGTVANVLKTSKR